MARLKTADYRFDSGRDREEEYLLKTVINVNSEGIFTTTIPIHAVEFLEFRGVNPGNNRRGTAGYYQARSLEELGKALKLDFEEAMSMDFVSKKIVIMYQVETIVSYCMSKGEVVPNGGWVEGEQFKWLGGSKDIHAGKRGPFGMLVFVEAKTKTTYNLKSGKEVVKYSPAFPDNNLRRRDKEDPNYNLRWIDAVCSMGTIDSTEMIEVDYTEEIAKVFVDLIKGIVYLSDKMKTVQTEEGLKEIVASNQKLIG